MQRQIMMTLQCQRPLTERRQIIPPFFLLHPVRLCLVLKSVYDPEVPVDIYDLGLVYNFSVNCEGKVDVKMTLTSPACPVAGTLPIEVESKIRDIDGITQCNVDLVWDPPWDPSMMTEAARLKLNL